MTLLRLLFVLAGAGAVAYLFLASLDPNRGDGLDGLLGRTPVTWEANPEDPWFAYLAPEGVCPGSGAHERPLTEQAQAMTCLINYARQQKGLAPLKDNGKLAKAAQLKAELIVRCDEFSHTPCRTPFSAVFKEAGYGEGATFASVGENLAYGEDEEGSPRATLFNWLHSPEHRQNLFTAKWRVQGLTVVAPPEFLHHRDVAVWVSVFGVSG